MKALITVAIDFKPKTKITKSDIAEYAREMVDPSGKDLTDGKVAKSIKGFPTVKNIEIA